VEWVGEPVVAESASLNPQSTIQWYPDEDIDYRLLSMSELADFRCDCCGSLSKSEMEVTKNFPPTQPSMMIQFSIAPTDFLREKIHRAVHHIQTLRGFQFFLARRSPHHPPPRSDADSSARPPAIHDARLDCSASYSP
jgi:hypothetical protein